MKTETMVWIGVGVGAFLLANSLTKGKASQELGSSIGNAAGSIVVSAPSGLVIGGLQSLQNAEKWAKEQESIPVIDWVAKPIGTAWGNIQTFAAATDKLAWLKRVTGG